MFNEKIRFIAVALIVSAVILCFPSSSFAEFGVSYGFMIARDSDAYGDKVYEVADDAGDATDHWGLSDADAFSAFGIYYGHRGDTGLGFDIATRTPYYIDVERDAFGSGQPSWEYKRLVWPAASFSLRKQFAYQRAASPYLGAGMGIYYLETDLDSDTLKNFHQTKFLPSLDFFAGLMFGRHFFIEVRQERTRIASATKDRGLSTGYPYDFDDDGDLGVFMFSLGGAW